MSGAVRINDPKISVEIITAWFRRVVVHTKVEDVSPARRMDFHICVANGYETRLTRLIRCTPGTNSAAAYTISLHPFGMSTPPDTCD